MSYEDTVLRALAGTLAAIPGLQTSAYMLSNPTPPAVEILAGELSYDLTLQRGLDEWSCIVRVTVGASFDIGSQRRLRKFRDPKGADSIKAALEANRTLGGLIEDLHVTKASAIRQFRRPDGTTVLGCDFNVSYYGRGDGS